MAGDHQVRRATPRDYEAIIGVASEWWGRDVVPGLPRLFVDHFCATSLCVENLDGTLVAFLVGFHSPSQPAEAYIHYVAVHPAERGSGMARGLYERFFREALADGRRTVRAVTSPANEQSVEFHRRMGFTVAGPVADYNGPGRDMVVFTRSLP